jgi:hypothetical protein
MQESNSFREISSKLTRKEEISSVNITSLWSLMENSPVQINKTLLTVCMLGMLTGGGMCGCIIAWGW